MNSNEQPFVARLSAFSIPPHRMMFLSSVTERLGNRRRSTSVFSFGPRFRQFSNHKNPPLKSQPHGRTHHSPTEAQSRPSRFEQSARFTVMTYWLSQFKPSARGGLPVTRAPHPHALVRTLGPSSIMAPLVLKACDLIWRPDGQESAPVSDEPTSDDEDSQDESVYQTARKRRCTREEVR